MEGREKEGREGRRDRQTEGGMERWTEKENPKLRTFYFLLITYQ